MIVKSSRIFIEALMSIVLSLLGPSDEGAGDAEFPLHAPGQVPAPLVALVRDPEVGDHPTALLLQLRRAPAVAALQLGVEPEVLGHRQPATPVIYSRENTRRRGCRIKLGLASAVN